MRITHTLLIASTLTLGACTTEVVREVPVSTDTRPPATAPAASKWDNYLDEVKANASTYGWTNSDLTDTGSLVCEALDSGNSVREVAAVMEESAVTNDDIAIFAAVLYAAVLHLCPAYTQAMYDFIGSDA